MHNWCIVAVLENGMKSPKVCKQIDCTIGVDVIEKKDISLLPNPTTGILQVICHASQVTSIEVFDIFGRNQLLLMPPESTIDISHLNAGIYFVRITTENGTVMKKIIKQ